MKRINICGINFKIKYVKNIPNSSNDVLGTANIHKAEILLKQGMNPELGTLIMLHEIFHVISALNALNFTEKQIAVTSANFYNVIKSNKKFMIY